MGLYRPNRELREPDGGSGGLEVTPGVSGIPAAQTQAPKIHAFEHKLGKDRRHEDSWTRTPNSTGTGAIHVKSFHCKLSDDAITFLDQQVNEWLDAHPQYEVKQVTSNIGEWSGKLGKEPHLVVTVWV